MFSNIKRLLPGSLYEAIEDKEDETSVDDRQLSQEERATRLSKRLWASNSLLLVVGLMLLVMDLAIAFRLASSLESVPSSDFSTPGFDKLARKDVKFIGDFEAPSPFRGAPGPKVDAEWNRFTVSPWIDGTSVVLGAGDEQIAHARKDRDDEWLNSTVKLGNENGGGVMASLEMFHQLHCLDLLRKYSHFNYAYYRSTGGTFAQDLDIQKNHIGTSGSLNEYICEITTLNFTELQEHCVEMIRQIIMCNGDTGLILFHWIERTRVPYPDFNVWHSCRDPEEILALAKRREAPITKRPSRTDSDVIMPIPS